VDALLKDVEVWRNVHGVGLPYAPQPGVLNSTDGPDHVRQRAAIQRYFMPPSIRAIRPRVQAIVDELFDAFAPKGRGDFVKEVAFPLPAIVIAELLGVPVADREWFKVRSDRVLRGLNGDAESQAGRLEADADMQAYLFDRIDEEAAAQASGKPEGEDLLSHMVAAWKRDGTLSRAEICAIGRVMLTAGHETTSSLIGMMMNRLMTEPGVAERLRVESELHPVFVEEVLRMDGPVQGLFRTNAHEAVVAGVTIPENTKVQMLFASANLDPARFEAPDRFSLDRDLRTLRQNNAAFGVGVHFCVGAPVARLEAELALVRMLSDLADAAPDGEPEYVKPFLLRGYESLPIRWTPPSLRGG